MTRLLRGCIFKVLQLLCGGVCQYFRNVPKDMHLLSVDISLVLSRFFQHYRVRSLCRKSIAGCGQVLQRPSTGVAAFCT